MQRRLRILESGGAASVFGLTLALLVLAGCSNEPSGYDPDLRFLLRSDPIVTQLPPTPPVDIHPNGKLDESISELPNRGGRIADPSERPKSERDRLATVLDELFGTPASPKLPEPLFDLTPDVLAQGSRIYKDKCAQCHGNTGNGRGPTGMFVYPHPRDFRLARFKYLSNTSGLPTLDDLSAIVRMGIGGNSMPGFAMLPPEHIRAVVGYTIHLSLRGRVEHDLLTAVLSLDGLDDTPEAFARERFDHWRKRWLAADAKVVRPIVPPLELKEGDTDSQYDESLRRGLKYFSVAACASCHRDYGRETHYLYDEWGVAVRPSNLTLGTYRAGGEPLDLFHRIRCGILPSGMPGVAPSTLADEQVWDLVRFVLALPTPRLLPRDVRTKIYPDAAN